MRISDKIEAFITELMKEESEYLELQRNELASIFNCVPSQINYVIATRFNRDRGYVVESRRGGGGYVRIRRIDNKGSILLDIHSAIGDTLSENEVNSYVSRLLGMNIINEREAAIILSATDDNALRSINSGKDIVRADIFKNILYNMV